MTYPTAAVNTANIDASGDSPALARSDILDAIQKLNQMIAHTTAFAATLLDDLDAATARGTLGAAASGANTDITSLAAPALGAATATTQAGSDNSTKVATTAQVQSAVAANAIGVGQTMTGFASTDRPLGSTFLNSTGKTIVVYISVCLYSSGSLQGHVSYSLQGQLTHTVSGAQILTMITLIVPPGAYYGTSVSGTPPVWTSWAELR